MGSRMVDGRSRRGGVQLAMAGPEVKKQKGKGRTHIDDIVNTTCILQPYSGPGR